MAIIESSWQDLSQFGCIRIFLKVFQLIFSELSDNLIASVSKTDHSLLKNQAGKTCTVVVNSGIYSNGFVTIFTFWIWTEGKFIFKFVNTYSIIIMRPLSSQAGKTCILWS